MFWLLNDGSLPLCYFEIANAGQLRCRSAKGPSLQWNDEIANQQVPSGHCQLEFDLQLLSEITSYSPWFPLSSLWRALLSTLSLSQDGQRRCPISLYNLFSCAFHVVNHKYFQTCLISILEVPFGLILVHERLATCKTSAETWELQTSTWHVWLPALNVPCSE